MAKTPKTTPAETTTQWTVQRQIDRQYFDGDGWTYDPAKAFRTPKREEAVNIAAYLYRVTPGRVHAAIIRD